MLRTAKGKLPIAVSVFLVALVSQGFAQSPTADPMDRIRGVIVESEVVTLAGNVHPLAQPEFDLGALTPEMRLERMVLVLQADAVRQAELDALTEAQQNPESPLYHQWLTPAEYGARFGASPGDLARISGWLQGHGFTVEPVPAGRRTIVFSGTAAQVEDTFHAQMHRYAVGGQNHLANSEDPQVPKALAPVVAGVLSLHDFRRISATRTITAIATPNSAVVENTQGSTHYIFPADFATIYNLNPLYAAGKNGSGASIAIVGRSNINLSDVSSFRSTAGLPANQPTVILDGANPGLVSGDQDEATLDVEWSGAIGSGAAVKYVVAASTQATDGVDLSAQYIVNNKTATVMSTSFGNCEAYMGAAELAFYNSLWQQAASEGISSFVSSGDSGAAGCNSGSSTSGSRADVNGLCSSPYATCVGGTEFNEGANSPIYWGTTNGAGGGSVLSYIPEKVWNESASYGGSGLWSSGGGVSSTYTQPGWQVGVPGANSNGMRALPDVALTAAGHDGYLICENGSWYVVAGTSAASPSFAGIMSLVVQKQNGAGQGNANPALYGRLSAGTNPFHPTPTGNNSVPGVSGFTASGAAYNLATGLGSVDANLLVNGWAESGGTAPQKGFTLKPSVTALSLLQGKTATFTIALAATGGFSDSVALKAMAPSGMTVSFSPTSIKPGASTTATISAASVAAGSYSITITGTSASIATKTSMAVQVKPAPAIKLGLSTALIQMTSSGTQTVTVTATPQGGVVPKANLAGVSFKVTGLPTGITASWGTPSLTAVGAVQAVLTLTGSKAASGSNSKLTLTGTVTASGALYSATQQESLVVARVAAIAPLPIRER